MMMTTTWSRGKNIAHDLRYDINGDGRYEEDFPNLERVLANELD
jgi:hypothetical protein